MWRLARLLLPLLAIAGCGAGKEEKSMNGSSDLAHFAITSSDFADGQPIPEVHSCDGEDRSPALQWADPPEGTKSLALIVDDPDAPSGTFHHWGAYDIPSSARSIAAGEAAGKPATNDGGKSGYMGPCPPNGHGPHHYRFKLYALDVDRLDVAAGAKIPEVEAAAQKHQIGLAQLTGTYERK